MIEENDLSGLDFAVDMMRGGNVVSELKVAQRELVEAKALIKRIISAFDSKPSMAPIIYEARAFVGQPVKGPKHDL